VRQYLWSAGCPTTIQQNEEQLKLLGGKAAKALFFYERKLLEPGSLNLVPELSTEEEE